MTEETMENKIYAELLSQGSYLRVSKRLIATLGLEMSVFLSYLIDKYEYYSNNDLLKDDYFYATNNDILIFTGLNENKVQKLKLEGEKLGLFSLKKIGNPAKTYYSINFEKLNDIFIQNKSLEELSYERIFKDKLDLENINRSYLEELSIRELRLVCKYFLIRYLGNDKKEVLIDNIIKCSLKNKKEELSSEEDIESFSYKKLRKLCKQLNISYSGNNKKEDLKNKIFEYFAEKKVDVLVNKKIVNKWTNNLLTSEQKNCHNQEQITITKKQDQNHNHNDDEVNEFKNLFKEFKINFTLRNKNSIKSLLSNMTKEEVTAYLKETFNNLSSNPNVNNVPALFSEKISKGEMQEPLLKKELDLEKRKWLNYYSGIINNIVLKEEIEKIIVDIPIEILNKNRSKLGMMNGFEFKQHLHLLKKQNISS